MSPRKLLHNLSASLLVIIPHLLELMGIADGGAFTTSLGADTNGGAGHDGARAAVKSPAHARQDGEEFQKKLNTALQ